MPAFRCLWCFTTVILAGNYKIRMEPGAFLRAGCVGCGKKQVVEIELEQVFDAPAIQARFEATF